MRSIKLLSEPNLVLLALAWTLIILIASLISLGNMPSVEVPGKDKTLHFIFYFVLTLLWNFSLQKKYNTLSLKYIVVIAVIIFGIIIEVLQGVLTKNRQADLFDVFANSAGALVALIIIFWLNFKTFNKKF